MATRSPRTPVANPDEKIIQAHMRLIEEDINALRGIMSTANGSADAVREFTKELPTVQPQVTAVTNKVAEIATESDKAQEAYRAATIAAASGNTATVESKATEVGNHLRRLKTLDAERTTLFETAQAAVDKKRPFEAIVEEIKGIQSDVRELLTKATEKATAAQETVNAARAKLPVGALTGRTKTAAEMAQSLAPSVKEAEARLRDANSAATDLATRSGEVDAALTAANTAAGSDDKPAADEALKRAKTAKAKADETAVNMGLKEKEGESQPASEVPSGDTQKTTSAIDGLPMKLSGRLLALGVELIAILVFVPGWLKPVFGLAWIILLVLSFAPNIGQNPKWARVFWAFAGVILLSIALTYLLPVFTGGESVADAVRESVPSGAQPTSTPTWKLK